MGRGSAAYTNARRRDDRYRVQQIVQGAARREKKGWHVGQHDRFHPLALHAVRSGENDHEARGSLQYQHQRRAHFRLLPTQKVTFVRQATVRPDLPRLHWESGIGWSEGRSMLMMSCHLRVCFGQAHMPS